MLHNHKNISKIEFIISYNIIYAKNIINIINIFYFFGI